MKPSITNLLLIAAILVLPGCATLQGLKITTAQGIAIGEPLATAGIGAALRNNPKYIPVAQKVGPDLASQNYTDLSLAGINAAVAAAVAKEGGDADLAALFSAGIDAGVAGYLGAVAESSLANDPNAQLVIQGLGKAVTDGAAWAIANPKAGP